MPTKKSTKKTKKSKTKSRSSSRNNYIPKYTVTHQSGFGQVKYELDNGESIVTNRGAMNYFDSDMHIKTSSRGGILKGMFRKGLTSEGMFLTTYTGTNKNQILKCSALFPGHILDLTIKPGERWMISPKCLVSFTDNLDTNSKRRLRGIFMSEGIYQTEFINNSNQNGMIWLSSYGGVEKLTLKSGENLKVDNGLFLCASSDVKYNIKGMGNFKSTFFSGEGIVMEFHGPCSLYVQGNSVDNFLDYITEHVIDKIPNKKTEINFDY